MGRPRKADVTLKISVSGKEYGLGCKLKRNDKLRTILKDMFAMVTSEVQKVHYQPTKLRRAVMAKGGNKPKQMPVKLAAGGSAKARKGGFPGIAKAPAPKKGK